MISITILESLFGHILRGDLDISANKAVEAFFVPTGDTFRGRPITTLPTVINKDHIRKPKGELKFKTKNDLDRLRSVAEDRP